MCKWAGICFNTHPGCDDAQECSWAPKQRKQMNKELLADLNHDPDDEALSEFSGDSFMRHLNRTMLKPEDYHAEFEKIPLHVETEQVLQHQRLHALFSKIPAEHLKSLIEQLQEFQWHQATGNYITLDDILNLQISLESTKSVEEFLSIL